MSKKSIIWIGIILLILLAILCILLNAERIEGKLQNAAKAAFVEAGLPEDIITFDGRDAILAGNIGSEDLKNKAMDILSAMPGVRAIHDKLNIESGELMPHISFNFDNGKVTLDGLLPDQDLLDNLLEMAKAKFGVSNIINNVKIDENVSRPAWLTNLPNIFSTLLDNLKIGSFSFDGIMPDLSWSKLSNLGIDGLLAKLKGFLPEGMSINSLELESEMDTDDTETAIVTAAEMQAKIDDLLKKSPLHFNTARSDLSSTTMATLKSMVEILELNTDLPVDILGHADSRGAQEFNQTLSEERALSVKKYLVRQGIDSSRMSVVGYGENKPIADNSTPEGQQKNRRVEINLKEAK